MQERIYFDAVLEPNRPLSPKGIALLVCGTAFISFAAGIMFVLHGAWPVTPFLGADVVLLYWALKVNVRASKRREHLVLTSNCFLIERISAKGLVRRETLNPYWLRVDHADPDLLGCELALVERGRRWIVGSFLGAEERAGLAEALRRALNDARRA